MQTPPKITVIVPVYKAQAWLAECVDSILAQSFTDFQCILVDDGSPDNSGTLCDEYAARDGRIAVIHQKNAGVSAARNAGIAAARGTYITFCDADDTLSPAAFGLALAAQAAHPADAICWRMTRSETQLAQRLSGDETIYTAPQHRAYVTTVDGHGVWNKLFWAAVIRQGNLRFDTALAKAEDYAFNGAYFAQFFAQSPNACIRQLDDALYFYRENAASVTHQKKQRNKNGRVQYNPADYPCYAQALRQEYAALSTAMNGWQGVPYADLAPQLRSFIRRFAFAVWLAKQRGEALPSGFFAWAELREILQLLQKNRIYTPYYLPFCWHARRLLAALYQSDESGADTLRSAMFLLGYNLLLRRWKLE